MNSKELNEKYGEELEKIFADITPSQFMHEDAEYNTFDTFLTWEVEDHYGGEGDGDQYWTVYKFTDTRDQTEFYIEFSGWYASYVGSEFEEWSFVEPKEVVVTQFHKV